MKKSMMMLAGVVMAVANIASADIFGTGANEFTIDFVNISGDASSANGTDIGYDGTFNDPSNDYRMGTYEITNAQWGKFVNAYGILTGSPSSAYDESSLWTGTNVPTNELSWYEAAQFTNWLNTSSGYSQAYKFTGTQGQSDYTFVSWDVDDAGYDASNPYRNREAFYFLPTADEWIKAAYWNGTALQTYANASAEDIVSGSPDPAKWNYAPSVGNEPWDVGTGSEELNGTFDMMGNLWELMESSYFSGDYTADSIRCIMGGSYVNNDYTLRSSYSHNHYPYHESFDVGFRVASVPEPTFPPDANSNGPYTVFVGDPLTLDGSGSTDPDDDIVSYLWDLDDDEIYETDAGSEAIFTVDYAYLESIDLHVNHTYTIHLKVTDSEGQSDIAESTFVIIPKPAVKVAFDIKPGSCPNPLNTKSSGVLPVAILGSADLDVTTIDTASILLAGVQPLRSRYEDVAAPLVDANDCDCLELGPDGIIDLTLKFETHKIVETLGEVNHGDIRELQLTGILYNPAPYETPIEGKDCIVIKGRHKPINKADINEDGLVNVVDMAIVAENWMKSSIVEE